MKILLLTLMMLFSQASFSAETRAWTDTELVLGATATSLYLIDWATTKNMTQRYSEGYREKGPVVKAMFGDQPKGREIDLYFAALVPGVLFAADQFPQYRKTILVSVIIAEGLAVRNNRKIGLQFQF